MLEDIQSRTLNALHSCELTQAEQLILCINASSSSPISLSALKEVGRDFGISDIDKWNISCVLHRAKGYAAKLPDGWILTDRGKRCAVNLIQSDLMPKNEEQSLRKCAERIPNKQVKGFVDEAIACFEIRCMRSAVLMSWEGALALLYEHVVNSYLASFNNEAARRLKKWKPAKTVDDLADMRESDFLDIINYLSIIGKSTKEQLRECLALRNGCCHPNMLQVGEARARAHLETLINNVYGRFC